MRVPARLRLIVPSSASSTRYRWIKTPPGGVNSLSVSRLIALGGEISRQKPPSLIFPSIPLLSRRRRMLPLQLQNLLDPSRKIFLLPSQLAAHQRTVFSKNHAW